MLEKGIPTIFIQTFCNLLSADLLRSYALKVIKRLPWCSNGMKNGTHPPIRLYSYFLDRYLGFAHGLSGIVSILLLLSQLRTHAHSDKLMDKEKWDEVLDKLRGCLDFIKTTVFPSGNYPTRGILNIAYQFSNFSIFEAHTNL